MVAAQYVTTSTDTNPNTTVITTKIITTIIIMLLSLQMARPQWKQSTSMPELCRIGSSSDPSHTPALSFLSLRRAYIRKYNTLILGQYAGQNVQLACHQIFYCFGLDMLLIDPSPAMAVSQLAPSNWILQGRINKLASYLVTVPCCLATVPGCFTGHLYLAPVLSICIL